MASHKYRSALLDALSGKEIPIETTLQEVISLMGVEAPSHPLLAFSNEKLEGATHIGHCKSPLNAWVPRFQ